MLPQGQLLPGSFENQPLPKSCSAAGKFHQGKQKGNRKADAESLNEILNCAILTLKTTSSQAKEAEKQTGGAEGLKTKIAGTQQMAIGFVQGMLVPMLTSFGMADTAKVLNLDLITISLGVPSYKNGYAISLKLPGLTKVFADILNAFVFQGKEQLSAALPIAANRSSEKCTPLLFAKPVCHSTIYVDEAGRFP